MECISVQEAAKRWNLSERRVLQFCASGRVDGASRFGRLWMIPADANKPEALRRGPRKKKDGGRENA